MKKEYNIVGLDCGHCALTLEKYLQKVDGVKECTINFSTSKLFIEFEEGKFKETWKRIVTTTKQVNPDVKISEDKNESNSIKIFDIILYVIGLLLGIIVIFVPLGNILYYSLLIISAILMGYKTYLKAILQLRYFRINENTLITISIIGACLLGESMEGLMVIALYTFGKMLESKAVNYSKKSISALISTQPEYAVIYNDNIEKKVKPESVKIGDFIIVKAGEKVALDGVVVNGCANVDKKHLTGESLPISVGVNDVVESGSIIIDSMLVIKVTSEYKDSTVSKILSLVSSASTKKSKTETFISKFSSFYTLGVIIASIVVWGITWAVLGDINVAIYRGLIFLVVSCPCAFAISVPLSYFSGIGRCSKQGILIKGSNYLDICSKLKNVVFDKTGTLTTGKFVVVKVDSIKIKEEKLLEIVVAGEKKSLHPIASAICDYYGKDSKLVIDNFKEIAGKGIEYSIGKDKYFVGKIQDGCGYTIVNVVKNDKEIGKIYLQDCIKDNAMSTISDIKNLGLKTIMLTGDNNSVACKVSNELGVDEYKAELLPKDKYKCLQEMITKSDNKTAFVGDGINDAPALTLSDVGISMGLMGSQATIESSDVVIADDNISKVTDLIKISKYTKKIVLQNIVFACATKLTFLLLGALGITGMLFAVFADVGVTLIAILNSLRVLSFKNKDKK